jgi:hypothetical protein
MGHGTYSVTNSVARSATYDSMDLNDIFTRDTIDNAMNPHGVLVRESRDSVDHPNSFPVIIALDETGSMGKIPEYLVKKGFVHIMSQIIDGGELDPQVLFLGIGDHVFDRAPLQVGQFESNDELLDRWLTNVFLEGRGGGNEGESYSLAWHFGGFKTSTDSFEKRGRKGLLFTIGDEPTLDVSAYDLTKIYGPGQYQAFTAAQLLEKARETYNVYHIHVRAGSNGRSQRVMDGWKNLIGENLIIVEGAEDVAQAIADTVLKHKQGTSVAESTTNEEVL